MLSILLVLDVSKLERFIDLNVLQFLNNPPIFSTEEVLNEDKFNSFNEKQFANIYPIFFT